MGRFGYYTHYQEPSFGLLQLGVRHYDPSKGVFTQKDPVKDGLNWYAYAGNGPVNVVDPSGLRQESRSRAPLSLEYHVASSGESYPYSTNWDISAGWGSVSKSLFSVEALLYGASDLALGTVAWNITPQASNLYHHWIGNSGDGNALIKSCPYARDDFLADVNSAKTYARKLAQREEPYRLLSKIGQSNSYGGSLDWEKTLGGFDVFAEAFVTVSEKTITMQYTWHIRDPYKFETNMNKWHSYGWAHNFMMTGSVTRNYSFAR